MFDTRATWLADQRERFLTRSVMYTRGLASVSISATLGRSVFEQADEYGVLHRVELRDYIVLPDSIVLNDAVSEPLRGDTITDGDETYMVASVPGEPPWRYCDAHQKSIRIHTKRTG